MSASALRFASAWPDAAALADRLIDRHADAFGRAPHAWSVTDRADDAATAAVLLTTDAAQADRAHAAGAAVVLSEARNGERIDTVHDRLGTYRFAAPATGAVFGERFVAMFGAALALAFEPRDALCVARAWIAEAAADALAWPARFDALPRVLEPALPCAASPDLAFAPCPPRLGVYAVVPDAEWVERLVALKVPTVQLRVKSDDARAVAGQVRRAAAAARGSQTRLFINDHWRVALDVHAQTPDSGLYGIHLGQEDIDDADLAAIRASGLRLGISTHGYAEMLRVAALNPSYLALGAVFATPTKTMPTVPQGLGRLFAHAAAMRSRVPAPPLVAIGGIDLAAMPRVLESGVGGVAVVRAITQAEDVLAAVQALQATFAAHARA
ncbi:thiamine phosphate synthase [Ralstonia pseudosolanacearum]|uniref:thiamine phosphate synthase n=1 Tax=Ralstonia pseudosolanacearum TaxID=1310165 RepID=UPI0026761C8B|nr:thiamine phosphate synthase [Ralstonia pseudosolanacearum]MDO3523825.1 thiamine phosphate synthase [Ralstonia pseudosolanacearum]MDO3548311.1 thiamine phosphate synthase [Ralstonia pseudosolanacearum]MDO3553136.1 thiamine phosphate synthase [Ralstonia pseudosolanacearum]MDO3567063.1 thiamine phosphate synthase [Ralstonia pseudosolanacearum]MDO3581240.1 thiamine phosphate synthase [Ralstonia pseudosolanacearum]